MNKTNYKTEKEYKPTEELEAKEGYIKDFLTNRFIRLTPEESVRQIMLMRLVQEYEYPKEWIKTNFEIQKWFLKMQKVRIKKIFGLLLKPNEKTFRWY